jgi:hypothetical protein
MKFTLIVGPIATICLLLFQSKEIEIGKPLPKDVVIDTSQHYYQIAGASNMVPAVALTQRGIKYTVVLSIKKEVSFVVTLDSMFKTKDGFKIGTSYKQLRKKYSGAGQFEPGYGYYFQLANGWKAMFTNDKVISDGKMHDSYRITSFFKRDY